MQLLVDPRLELVGVALEVLEAARVLELLPLGSGLLLEVVIPGQHLARGKMRRYGGTKRETPAATRNPAHRFAPLLDVFGRLQDLHLLRRRNLLHVAKNKDDVVGRRSRRGAREANGARTGNERGRDGLRREGNRRDGETAKRRHTLGHRPTINVASAALRNSDRNLVFNMNSFRLQICNSPTLFSVMIF